MEFNFLSHSDCPEDLLIEISKLKKEFWNYPIKDQMLWIKNNIKETDVHLVLKEKNVLIGYLTLTNEQILCKKEIKEFIGIGSVCISEKHRGKKLGLLLIKLVDYFLSQKGVSGVLLCKNELFQFYNKCGWEVYNGDVYYKKEKFKDLLFFSNKGQEKIECITLSKLF